MTNKQAKPRSFKYQFRYDDGTQFEFEVALDDRGFIKPKVTNREPPRWTHLEYEKCEHCPLNLKDQQSCPVALNLAPIIEAFQKKVSHENAMVVVFTPERSFAKRTSTQEGLQSLVGLIMATSPCPAMKFLKPMAQFHLPFASLDETMVRSVSMYLLSQYFKEKSGGQGDFTLQELDKSYQNVHWVNEGILARIRTMAQRDAGRNAITILDAFATMVTGKKKSNLDTLARLFESTLQA